MALSADLSKQILRAVEDGAREITQRIASFAASDSFLANHPPKVVFNGFYAEGYVLEDGSESRRRWRCLLPNGAARSR